MTLLLTDCISIFSPPFCSYEITSVQEQFPSIWEFGNPSFSDCWYLLCPFSHLEYVELGRCSNLIRFGPLLQQRACRHQSLNWTECLQVPSKSLHTHAWEEAVTAVPLLLSLTSPASVTAAIQAGECFPVLPFPANDRSWGRSLRHLGCAKNRQGMKIFQSSSCYTWLCVCADESWEVECLEGIISQAAICQSSSCFSRPTGVSN